FQIIYMSDPKSFVAIKPDSGGISLVYNHTTLIKVVKGESKVTCYIPGFDIFFGANNHDEESISKKSREIMQMFFDHLFLHSGNNGLKSCALQLHKLGFRATNDAFVIKSLIQNQRVSAKFNLSSATIPENFKESKSISQEA